MARSDTLTSWRLWLARAACLFTLVVVLLTLSQLWPRNQVYTYSEWTVSSTYGAVTTFMDFWRFVGFVGLIESLAALTSLGMALLIFFRKSASAMGLFVSAFLLLLAPWCLSGNMDVWSLPAWVPFADAIHTLQTTATLGSVLLFIYIFPDGRFTPGWARWFALLAPLVWLWWALWDVLPALQPAGWADHFWVVLAIPFMVSIIAAGLFQLVRYRATTDPVQRQQMKWVVFGLSLLSAMFVVTFAASLLPDYPWLRLALLLGELGIRWLIPLTIGVAVLRYRLWDIDLWIRRTLVYGGLTVAVLALYAALIGGLAFLLQGRIEPPLAALATVAVALLALPLRNRLQHGVNHLLYGERDDPMALLARLGGSLETAASAQSALPAVAESVRKALRLPYAAVLLGAGDATTVAAEHGRRPGWGLERASMTYGEELVGWLEVARRSADEPLSAADRRVLSQIARQAGAGLHAVRLTDDLRRSRELLVAAREEERRRLHRDLHDGLGPQLASLALKAAAASNRLPKEPEAAARLLGEIKAQAQAAIGDIRQLVYDLRPLPLDQLGLASALRQHAASLSAAGPMEVRVECADLPPLPAATEVAAYRIALEALTNAARHGNATRCAVRLSVNGRLRLEVTDNGRGIPDGRPAGVGLRSMRERAEELGGACRIENLPEGGAAVLVELPLR